MLGSHICDSALRVAAIYKFGGIATNNDYIANIRGAHSQIVVTDRCSIATHRNGSQDASVHCDHFGWAKTSAAKGSKRRGIAMHRSATQ